MTGEKGIKGERGKRGMKGHRGELGLVGLKVSHFVEINLLCSNGRIIQLKNHHATLLF